MNKDQFWQIIDSVNQSSPTADQKTRLRCVTEKLSQYPVEDILDWHLILSEYAKAAYRKDLWRASSSIGAHDTDDGFIDFRSWLISRGKETYMNALRDPASLRTVPLNGEKPNFELFGYTASAAYDMKLYKEPPIGLSKMYDDLKTHTLDPQTIKDIWTEIPPGQLIDQEQPPQSIEELLDTEDVVYGYVYQSGQCTEYVFYNTPENIANFLGSWLNADEVTVTDTMDRLILNTFGSFIDRCPDQDLLEEIKKTLIPIQLGKAKAQPFFCPTMDEVDEYCNQQQEQEQNDGQTLL